MLHMSHCVECGLCYVDLPTPPNSPNYPICGLTFCTTMAPPCGMTQKHLRCLHLAFCRYIAGLSYPLSGSQQCTLLFVACYFPCLWCNHDLLLFFPGCPPPVFSYAVFKVSLTAIRRDGCGTRWWKCSILFDPWRCHWWTLGKPAFGNRRYCCCSLLLSPLCTPLMKPGTPRGTVCLQLVHGSWKRDEPAASNRTAIVFFSTPVWNRTDIIFLCPLLYSSDGLVVIPLVGKPQWKKTLS